MDKVKTFFEEKKKIIILVISGLSLLLSILKVLKLPFDIAWVAIILCGIPIIIEAIEGLVKRHDIKADLLVSIALVASIIIREDFAAGEVAFIMQIGELLEDLTVDKAREGIEKLVKLTPKTARVIVDGNENIILAENVKVGDIIKVLPGEIIAVDGIIIEGDTSINQSIVTGESMPIDKTVGDEVYAGTNNLFGAFTMKATKVGVDSSINRMIKLVESADASKAKVVGIADKWATVIVILALSASIITYIITHEIIRAVTILVVFCPCSLVLATPAAIMAAIGNATKHGFLVSVGDALERFSDVNMITFDKTGTLTYGKAKVSDVRVYDNEINDDEIYKCVASVEKMSEHPIGKAIVSSYKSKFGDTYYDVDNFNMIPGKGISAVVDGNHVLIGSIKYLADSGVNVFGADHSGTNDITNSASTVIYVAFDKKLVGFVALTDTIRDRAKVTVEKIKDMGVKPVLITGDNQKVSSYVAELVGIGDVKADCLPEDKLKFIDSYQKDKYNVAMIGDGINDAPALKKADVGLAMGGIGSDITVGVADIVIVEDKIEELPHLINLSRKMMTTIKINITFSMILNFVAVILAAIGTLNPIVGALVHNVGSVIVVTNAALLLKFKG